MAQVTIGSILPVGTVLHSMLTVAQFQAQYGTNWVLADGSSCTGTKYASVTGATTLPDMRGVFLRGKNNGSTRNPDGDLALGTYTADKFAAHTHSIDAFKGASGSTATNDPILYDESNVALNSFSTNSSGGNETAPKSVTVNIFIRVN